jgi:hypothetical protein
MLRQAHERAEAEWAYGKYFDEKCNDQLSIEEWTMIQTQLEMGIRPAVIV